MAINLLLLPMNSGLLSTMDDKTTNEDRNTSFQASIVTGKFSALGSAYAHFRSFLQQLFSADICTVTVIPITNDQPAPSAAQLFSYNFLVGENNGFGPSIQVEVPLFRGGVDHQVRLELEFHKGVTELGGAEMWLVPRRQRNV